MMWPHTRRFERSHGDKPLLVYVWTENGIGQMLSYQDTRASTKSTPCFSMFDVRFSSSHSKSMGCPRVRNSYSCLLRAWMILVDNMHKRTYTKFQRGSPSFAEADKPHASTARLADLRLRRASRGSFRTGSNTLFSRVVLGYQAEIAYRLEMAG